MVSVRQRWFPFENHGGQFEKRLYTGKIPLLPYIRRRHRKYSLARVFPSADGPNFSSRTSCRFWK